MQWYVVSIIWKDGRDTGNRFEYREDVLEAAFSFAMDCMKADWCKGFKIEKKED